MSWLPAHKFANWLCSLLRKYLSNVNEESVQVGLWNGDLTLKNLTVRKDAFKRLRVPLLVRCGCVGLVHLQVPWKSFGSGTLRLILKDVYISLEPIGSCLYGEETEMLIRNIIRSQKQAFIADMESVLRKEPGKKGSRLFRLLQGVVGLFISRALRSAKLEILNVHVVWCSGDRDNQVEGNEATNVAIGAYLGSLKAYPSVGSPLPFSKTMATNTSSSSQPSIDKAIEICQLLVYMHPRTVDNHCEGPMWPDEEDSINPSLLAEHRIVSLERIDGLLSVNLGRKDVKGSRAIFSSMRGDGQILPLAELHLKAEKIHCQASETQCMALTTALVEVNTARQRLRFRRFRPTVPIMENPIKWWQFAALAVIRELRKGGSWHYWQKNFVDANKSWKTMPHRIRLQSWYMKLYHRLILFGTALQLSSDPSNNVIHSNYEDTKSLSDVLLPAAISESFFLKNCALSPSIRTAFERLSLEGQQQQLSSSEASMLLMLEDELSVEEIILYRDIVKRRVKSNCGGSILQGSNIGAGSEIRSGTGIGGWWFQRSDKGQPRVKELSEWTGISQNEAKLVLEDLFQIGDTMSDTDTAIENAPVFFFEVGELELSVAGALDVHVLSPCIDVTSWAASEMSFRIILEKLNVKGVSRGDCDEQQQPMILLEGRGEKKGLANGTENDEKGQYLKKDQGLTLSVRRKRNGQQHGIEKVSDVLERGLVQTLQKHGIINFDVELVGVVDEVHLCFKEFQLVPLASLICMMHSIMSSGNIANNAPIPNPEHMKLKKLIAGREAYEKRGTQLLVNGEKRGMRSVHLDLKGIVAEVVLGGDENELDISSRNSKTSHHCRRSLILGVGRFCLRSGKHFIASELDKASTRLNHIPNSIAMESWYTRVEGITVSDELLSHNVMEPWGGEVLLSKCLINGHPTIPSLQADFFLEPIVLNITYGLMASMKSSTEAYRNLRNHYSCQPASNYIGVTIPPLQPTFINYNFPPRLEFLSSLVTHQASFFISRFEVRILTLSGPEENEKGAAAFDTHLLSSLPERLKNCVTLLLSEYEQHAVDMAHNKCPNYGLDAAFQMFHHRCRVILGGTLESTKMKDVRDVVEAIYYDIISGREALAGESKRNLAINDAVSLLMDSNIILQEQCPRKADPPYYLVALCIWDWKVSLLQLVYDARFDISAGGLSIVDGLGNTIMSWLKITSGKNRSSFGIGCAEELASSGTNFKHDRHDSTQGNYKRTTNQRLRQNRGGGSVEGGLKKVAQAAASEAAFSKQEFAILCSIVIQDDKYIFGLGGSPLTSLKNATTMPKMYGMGRLAAAKQVEPGSLCIDREVRFTLECGLVDISIDPQSLELIYYGLRRFRGVIGLQTRKINVKTTPSPDIPSAKKKTLNIHQHSSTMLHQRSSTATFPIEEVVKKDVNKSKPVNMRYTMAVHGTSMKVLVAQRGRLLGCLNVNGLEVGADSNPNIETNKGSGGGGPRFLLYGEVKSLSCFDLTPDGSSHYQIIKTSNTPLGSLSMQFGVGQTAAECCCLSFKQLPSGDVKIYTRGFNVCLTARFSREVSCYMGSFGVGPIIRQFIDAISRGTQSDRSRNVEVGSSSPLPSEKTVSGSPPSTKSKYVRIDAKDSTVIIPRNSHSLELAAIRVKRVKASIGWHQGSWHLPRDDTSVEERERQRGKQKAGATKSATETELASNEELLDHNSPGPSHLSEMDNAGMGLPMACYSGIVGRDRVDASSQRVCRHREGSDLRIQDSSSHHNYRLTSSGICAGEEEVIIPSYGDNTHSPSMGIPRDMQGEAPPSTASLFSVFSPTDTKWDTQATPSALALDVDDVSLESNKDSNKGGESIESDDDDDEFYDAIDAMNYNGMTIENEIQSEEPGFIPHRVDECISETTWRHETTIKRLWGVDEDEDIRDTPPHCKLQKCRRIQVSLSGVCLSVALLPCIERQTSPSADGSALCKSEEDEEECFVPPITWVVSDGCSVYKSSPICERSNTNKDAAIEVQSLSEATGESGIGDSELGGPCETFSSFSLPCSSLLLVWKDITNELVDFELIVDVGGDINHPRILLSTPEYSEEERSKEWLEGKKPNGFYANLSMASYYLLVALYFDNYCELPTFFGKLVPGYYTYAPPPTKWPEYGSPEMIEAVCNRLPLWEFALTIPIMEVLLSVDTEYFPHGPPSAWMATENGVGVTHMCNDDDGTALPPKALLPVAHIRMINSVVSVSGGGGVVKVFAGCGDVLVVDARDPHQTVHPCIFHAGMAAIPEPDIFQHWGSCRPRVDPAKECMGYNVSDYGMRQNKRYIYEPKEHQPVQTSVILTTADQWCCVNVGVHVPDMCAKDFSIVWLIVDIFSWFHRDPKYGCPFYGYYPPPNKKPIEFNPNSGILMTAPRSIDVRVWVIRPHLAMIERPLCKQTCAAVIEMPTGVFYRWQWFSIPEIIHMELVIGSLAVMIVQDYCSPVKQRGMRGSAGSGRGVRTLLNHFSLSLILNQWYSGNRIELSVSVPADKDDIANQDTERFGLNGPPLDIDVGKLIIPRPKAVQVVPDSSRTAGNCSGSLVTSYEDALYVMSSMVVLVGPPSEDVETPPHLHCRGGAGIAPALDNDDSSHPILDHNRMDRSSRRLHFLENDTSDTESVALGAYGGDDFALVRAATFPQSTVLHMDANDEEKIDNLVDVAYGGADNNSNGFTDSAFEQGVGTGDGCGVVGGPSDDAPCTMTIIVVLTGLQVMIVDQVLGLHLPILKLYIESLSCFTENRLEEEDKELEESLREGMGVYNERSSSNNNVNRMGEEQEQPNESDAVFEAIEPRDNNNVSSSRLMKTGSGVTPGSVKPPPFFDTIDGKQDASPRGNDGLESTMCNSKLSLISKAALSIAVQADIRVEYFNNLLKCWETMVEPFTGWVISDACSYRGSGLMFYASCPLRVNISSALLNTLSDVSQRLDLFIPHLSSTYIQSRIRSLRRIHEDEAGSNKVSQTDVVGRLLSATSISSPKPILLSSATQGGKKMSNSVVEEGDRRAPAAAASPKQQYYKICDASISNTQPNCSNGVMKELYTDSDRSPVVTCRPTRDRDSPSSDQMEGVLSPLRLFSETSDDDKESIAGGGFELHSADPSHEEDKNIVITHQMCASVPPDTRLAFSLLNSTGQEIRYFQPLENDLTRHLQYLQTSSRGMLIFGATMTTIRNGKVEEVPFPEQSEVIADGENNVTQPTIGPQEEEEAGESGGTSASHTFAMQVCGYRWLPCVYADHLGIRAFPLYPLIGRLSVHSLAPASHIQMATSLIASVYPLNGGRQVCLRSCFRLLNGTDHPVMLVEDTSPSVDSNASVPRRTPAGYNVIDPGQIHHFPLTLLQSSIEKSGGSSLGCFWVKPFKSVSSVFDPSRIGAPKTRKREAHSLNMDFCSVPIQLLRAVLDAQDLSSECIIRRQVSCPQIQVPLGKPHPPFSYCLELRRRKVKLETAGLINVDSDIKLVTDGSNPRDDEFHRLDNYSWKAGGSGEQLETISNKPRLPLPIISPRKGSKHRVSPFRSAESPRKKDIGEKRNSRCGGGVVGKPRRSKTGDNIPSDRVAYTYDIILYPPFIVENLLPHRAEFELIDQSHNLLWGSWLEPGESVGVHTIGMNETLLLLVNLEYARSNKGVVVHSGKLGNGWSGTKAGDGDVDVYTSDDTNGPANSVSNIVLTDTVGQKLQLNIKKSIGGKGYRQVSIYSSYWLVNTSNHSLRFKQDGVRGFPAGTVSKLGDGSRPVFFRDDETCLGVREKNCTTNAERRSFDSCDSVDYNDVDLSPPPQNYIMSPNHIFAGMPGPLRPTVTTSPCSDNIDLVSPVCSGRGMMASMRETLLKEELRIEELKRFACMFSFMDSGDDDLHSMPNWGEKLRVQVDDSMMSKAFSVDSIGVNQVLSVKNPQHGLYELGFNVTIPPGRLGQFTKVVQFWPHYVVMNEFEDRTIKLVQYSKLRVAQKDICIVKPREQVPFDIHEVWGKHNELRLSVGSGWGLSSCFPLDDAGEYTLRFRPYLEWHATSHMDTRGAPEYDEIIPAGVLELGIWFETDWYRRQLIVKSTKREKYAYKHTDIQRGDVLLCVNGKCTAGMSFSQAMSLIRDNLHDAADAVNDAADAFLEEEAVVLTQSEVKTDSGLSLRKGGETPRTVAPQFRNRIPKTNEVHPGTLLHFGTMEERYRLIRAKALNPKDRRELDDTTNPDSIDNSPHIGVISGVCNAHSGFASNVLHHDPPDLKISKSSTVPRKSQTVDSGEVRLRRAYTDEIRCSCNGVQSDLKGQASIDSSRYSSLLCVNESRGQDDTSNSSSTPVEKDQEDLYVRVELRPIAASLMVVISPMLPEQVPYIIENVDSSHCIYFRQKNAEFHPWNRLDPGEKCSYTWEEPMGIRRLNVRVGPEYLTVATRSLNTSRGGLLNVQAKAFSDLQRWGVGKVRSESEGTDSGNTRLIKLNGVGSEEKLPLPESEDKEGSGDPVWGNKPRQLHARVGAEGQKRILVVSSHNNARDTVASLCKSKEILKEQLYLCRSVLRKYERYSRLVSSMDLPSDDAVARIVRRRSLTCMDIDIPLSLPGLSHKKDVVSAYPHRHKSKQELLTEVNESIENVGAKYDVDDRNDVAINLVRELEKENRRKASDPNDIPEFDEVDAAEDWLWLDLGCGAVTGPNQLVVEVLEAKGLRGTSIGGTSNPYCYLYMKIPYALRRKGDAEQRAQTYFCEKTLNPKWIGQKFVFDVPREAAQSKRGFRLRVFILSNDHAFTLNEFVGQADVPLSVIQDGKERHGWFPLTRRSSKFMHPGAAGQVSGSIKLRVQWLHRTSSFISYRIQELNKLFSDLELKLSRTTQLVTHLKKEQIETVQKCRLGIQMNASLIHDRRVRLFRNLSSFGLKPLSGMPSKQTDSSLGRQVKSLILPRISTGIMDDSDLHSIEKAKGMSFCSKLSDCESLERQPSINLTYDRDSSIHSHSGRGGNNMLLDVETPSGLRQNNTGRQVLEDREDIRDMFNSSYSNCGDLCNNVGSCNMKRIMFKLKQNDASFGARISQLSSHLRQQQEERAGGTYLHSVFRVSNEEEEKPYSHLFLRRKSIKTTVSPCRRALMFGVDLNYKHVLQIGGTIRLSPLKALNLSDVTRKIFVVVTARLQRGLFVWESDRVHAAIQPIWDTRSKTCEFSVNAVETSSVMTVDLFAEAGVKGMTKKNYHLGSLHMRIASLIDCCMYQGRDKYCRWFPLVRPEEIARLEMLGEGGGGAGGGLFMAQNISEQRSRTDFNNRNPIVKLAVTWEPLTVPVTSHEAPANRMKGSTKLKPEHTRSYMCARFSEVGLGLVDSKKPVELLRMTGVGGDLRWSESAEFTRYSCVLESIQIDNQSNVVRGEAVVLVPTPVLSPCPTLQFSALQNNAKSHSKMQHFEYVSFLLQELDIRIEQRLVTDCVQFAITVLDYHQNRLKEGNAAHKLSMFHQNNPTSPISTPSHPYSGTLDPYLSAPGSPCQSSTLNFVVSPSLRSFDRGNVNRLLWEEDDLERTPEVSVDEFPREMYMYVRTLQIHPVKLNVSFTKNSDSKEVFKVLRAQERQASLDRDVDWGEQMLFQETIKMRRSDTVSYSIASSFPRFLAEFAINLTNDISPSPVRLNGMEIFDVCKTRDQLVLSLENHYFDALLRQLYKIVGSFEFLGDPVGALSQLGTGVWDFFYEPAEGLLHSPYAFGRGVAKGTLSLVSNTAGGILGFTTKITRSVGGGLAVLSMDKEFQMNRIQRRVKKEQSLKDGGKLRAVGKHMSQAGKELGGGFYRGVSGVFIQPYRRGKDSGAKGFVVGIFTGMAGLVTKPIVGCMDFVSHTGEAVRTMAGALTLMHTDVLRSVKRRRLPHTFGCDGRMMPYSSSLARGAAVLLKFPLSKDKNVLSLVGSIDVVSSCQLPSSQSEFPTDAKDLAKAREFPGSPEMLDLFLRMRTEQKECVIWTEVLFRELDRTTIVVVTTTRVVVSSAIQDSKRSDSVIELDWTALLESLAKLPRLVDTAGGGSILELSCYTAVESTIEHGLRRAGPAPSNIITRKIIVDYRIRPCLARLYNVISCLVHGRTTSVITTPRGSMVVGSTSSFFVAAELRSWSNDHATRHPRLACFNGWEFGERSGSWGSPHNHEQDELGASVKRKYALKNIWKPLSYSDDKRILATYLAFEMDSVYWKRFTELNCSGEVAPKWASEVTADSIFAPPNLKNLMCKSEPRKLDSQAILDVKLDLRVGKLTMYEFTAALDDLLRDGPYEEVPHSARSNAGQDLNTDMTTPWSPRMSALKKGKELVMKIKRGYNSIVKDGKTYGNPTESTRLKKRYPNSDDQLWKIKVFNDSKSEIRQGQVDQQVGKTQHGSLLCLNPEGTNGFADYENAVFESSPRGTRLSPTDRRDNSTVTSSVSHGGDIPM